MLGRTTWIAAVWTALFALTVSASALPPTPNRPGVHPHARSGRTHGAALGRVRLDSRARTKTRPAARRTPPRAASPARRRMPAAYRSPSPALGTSIGPTLDDDARTILVTHTDGRTHLTSPSLKRVIDARARAFIAGLRAAKAQGKRTIYISTPISAAGEFATNLEIAREIGEQLQRERGESIHVVNPGLLQGLLAADAHGEDFMHMWELTFEADLFDEVRFTSNDDVRAYFARHGREVPPAFDNVSALAGTGTQYEMQIFGQLIIGRRMSNAPPVRAQWGAREMDAHELDAFVPSRRYPPIE